MMCDVLLCCNICCCVTVYGGDQLCGVIYVIVCHALYCIMLYVVGVACVVLYVTGVLYCMMRCGVVC